MEFLSLKRAIRLDGFTLVELLIVIAIIGILGAIALPSYQEYVRKGRRVDAKNAVLDLAAREERFFATQNKYTSVTTDLGYATANTVNVLSGSTAYYVLKIDAATATTFTTSATPVGAQALDKCARYMIDNLGAQSNTTVSGGANSTPDCW